MILMHDRYFCVGSDNAYRDFLSFVNYQRPSGYSGITLPRWPSLAKAREIEDTLFSPWLPSNSRIVIKDGKGTVFPVGNDHYEASKICYIAGAQVIIKDGIESSISRTVDDFIKYLTDFLSSKGPVIKDSSFVATKIPQSDLDSIPSSLSPGDSCVEITGRLAFETKEIAREAAKLLKEEGKNGSYKFRSNSSYDRDFIVFKMPDLQKVCCFLTMYGYVCMFVCVCVCDVIDSIPISTLFLCLLVF